MGRDVVSICFPPERPQMTLREVNELVPILIRITKKHEGLISHAMQTQRFLIKSGAPQTRVTECDQLVGKEMGKWATKMFKLGAKVYSNGYLGFWSGFGFWSWRFPEPYCSWYTETEVDPNNGFRRKLSVRMDELP